MRHQIVAGRALPPDAVVTTRLLSGHGDDFVAMIHPHWVIRRYPEGREDGHGRLSV